VRTSVPVNGQQLLSVTPIYTLAQSLILYHRRPLNYHLIYSGRLLRPSSLFGKNSRRGQIPPIYSYWFFGELKFWVIVITYFVRISLIVMRQKTVLILSDVPQVDQASLHSHSHSPEVPLSGIPWVTIVTNIRPSVSLILSTTTLKVCLHTVENPVCCVEVFHRSSAHVHRFLSRDV